jgi:molybdate transport system substrate-binding protein
VNRRDPDREGSLRLPNRVFRLGLALVAALALLTAACGPDSKSSSASSASSSGAAATMTGNLDVFAAASLTEAFNNAKTTLTAANPGVKLTYNFAGSNALATQIQQGAPADVFASADQKNMQTLVTAGLVGTPVTFATNKLQIAVAPGNPKNITGLADLARSDVAVVLEAQGVPAGDYTRQVLAAKGTTVTPKSLETDVKSALAKVTSGEADATVVYVTDVKAAGSKVQGVTIPDADQPDISYPIAVVKATKNPSAAQAFVDSAVSGVVQQSVEAAGFSAPT